MSKRIGGYVLVVTGFLACPCHLVITMPIALALLSGTVIGAFLTENLAVVFVLSGVYFVGALVIGLRMVRVATGASSEACDACLPDTPMNPDNLGMPRSAPDRALPEAPAARRR